MYIMVFSTEQHEMDQLEASNLSRKEKDAEVSRADRRQDSFAQRKRYCLWMENRFCTQSFKAVNGLRAGLASLSSCILLNPLLQGNDVMQRLEHKPGLIVE